jgi:hypothetical protein
MKGVVWKWSRPMAVIIPFYIPRRFHKKDKWIPLELRGRILEFVRRVRRTA